MLKTTLVSMPCGIVIDGGHQSADSLNQAIIRFFEDYMEVPMSDRDDFTAEGADDDMSWSEALYWASEQCLAYMNNALETRYLWVDDNSLFLGCYDKSCEACCG